MIVDEMRRKFAARELLARDHIAQKRGRVMQPGDHHVVERQHHAAARLLAICAIADDLREQAVVVGADLGTLGQKRIDPHTRRIRQMQIRHAADRGTEVVLRVLGGDAAFDSRAARRNRIGDMLARRDSKLLGDQVASEANLGHRMLDLQARVDFQQVEFAIL